MLSLVLISFSAVQAQASQIVSDAEIERDVAWVLQTDSYLGDDLFRVRVRNGIVYLRGHVTTLWERTRAEELAARVNGVLAVENNLTYSVFRNVVSRRLCHTKTGNSGDWLLFCIPKSSLSP